MFAHVDPQTLKCFLNEMQDQPQQVRAVLAMDAPEAADWAQAARLVHAAKGAAAMIGLQPLSHLCFQLEEAFRDAESHAGPVEPSAKQAMAALVDVLEHLFQAATEHLDTGPLSPQSNQELAQRVVEGVDQFRQARSLPDNEEWNELRRQLLTEPPATATPPESLVELLGDGKIQIDDPTFAALLAESDESPDDETLVAVQRLIREELDAVNQGLSTFLDEPDNTGVLSRVIQSSRAVGEAARTIQREHLASLADNFARALQCAAEDRISVSADFGETLLLALEAMFDGHESDDDAYIAELSGRLRALVHEAPPSPTAAVPAPESLPNVAEIAEQIEADLAGRENVSAELLEVFLEEADEHINAIYVDLERLGREPEARESLQSIRRAAHTLKGAAGAVKLTVVSRLAHRMEDLLDELYERQLPTTPSAVQLLLNATDALQDLATGEFNRETIGQLVAELYMQFGSAITGETDAPVAPVESAVPTAPEIEIEEQVEEDASETERVAAARRRDAAQPNRGPALRVPVARLDELVSLVSEMIINRTAFEQRMQDFIRFVDEMQPVLNRLRTASNDIETRYSVEALRGRGFGSTDASWMRPSQSQISAERIEEFDELEFDRYTDFHLLSRSLAEATGDVATIANELRTLIGDFDSLLARQGRFTREAQDRLNRVRMVPLASLAARLHRAVRNVATQSGKQVELVLEGDDTALDKNVLDELSGALLHLVRNAVDHGVEGPAERLAAGKPECGRLRVTAYPEGTQVIVKVRDDGAGLDVGKIRAAAVARGLVPQTEAEEMESQQLFGLIFLPGFSTAEQVSEISGRGVGMDVVRDTVQRLKGSVSVESTHGRGSTFTIRLPMTLAGHPSLAGHRQQSDVRHPAAGGHQNPETGRFGRVATRRQVDAAAGRRQLSASLAGRTSHAARIERGRSRNRRHC